MMLRQTYFCKEWESNMKEIALMLVKALPSWMLIFFLLSESRHGQPARDPVTAQGPLHLDSAADLRG